MLIVSGALTLSSILNLRNCSCISVFHVLWMERKSLKLVLDMNSSCSMCFSRWSISVTLSSSIHRFVGLPVIPTKLLIMTPRFLPQVYTHKVSLCLHWNENMEHVFLMALYEEPTPFMEHSFVYLLHEIK